MITDFLVFGSTNTCRIRSKILAIRNLNYYTQRRVCLEKTYEDQNTLIEQSAAASNTLIEHSWPY